MKEILASSSLNNLYIASEGPFRLLKTEISFKMFSGQNFQMFGTMKENITIHQSINILKQLKKFSVFFSYLGFLSQTFMIHRTTVEKTNMGSLSFTFSIHLNKYHNNCIY